MSVFSPGVKWLTKRTKVALRYALANRIGRFKGHTARGGFRIDLQTLTSLIGRYDYQWREGDLTMRRIWVGINQSF